MRCSSVPVCLCLTVKPCTSGKWEVTCCLLKHQASEPLNHICMHNSYWHIVAFFLVLEYHGNMDTDTNPHPHTHTHLQAGGISLLPNSLCVCVESSPMRLFHTKMICSPWTVLCELAHTRLCVCTHETVQSLFILATTVSPYNVNH